MDIIIVGNGKVGSSLAEQLVREEHNVTIVDLKETALGRADETLDVMTKRGNGISTVTLEEVGAKTADLLVAATGSDEVNMVCCLIAKNMGTGYTIARIRNPEYTSSLAELRRNLKIDMVINPESTTATEITRLLRFPSAANIETFCRDRVELMGFRVQAGDFMVDKPLHAMSSEVKRLSILFCAVERAGGEVLIPNGNFVPKAGDKLYIIGRPESMDQFFRYLGRMTPKVRQALIIGGGKICSYLIDMLERLGVRVKIVEKNRAVCERLNERFPRATVICGDGTDQELLESENLTSFDAFVALTDQDEDNLIISLYAMQQGLPKIITKCNRQNYAGIVRAVGLDSVISPKFITASHILQVVRGMENSQGGVMNSLHRIADGAAEAMEFTVSPSTRHQKVPLKDLSRHLRRGVLIAVIVRGQNIIIPEGSSYLQTGDTVIVISRNSGIQDLNDIFYDEAGGAQ